MADNRINPTKEGKELGTQFYVFVGVDIMSTRSFCKERNGKYFHFKEIMDWASEDWEGKHPKTNEKTIFKYVGGYCMKGDRNERCTHMLMPVSQFVVPKDVLIRNIEKGYFQPSIKAKELLGLI